MARAKRTERAEARRRYRAANPTEPSRPRTTRAEADGAGADRGDARARAGQRDGDEPAPPERVGDRPPPSGSSFRPSTSATTSRRCRGSRSTRNALWLPLADHGREHDRRR